MNLKWKMAALGAAVMMSVGLLTACSGGDVSSSGSAPAPSASTAASTSQSTGESSSGSASVNAPAPALTDTQVSYKGMVFALNDDAAPVLEALGEPVNFRENISCMFEGGMDKTYEYEDLTIYTYPTDTEELILLIDITSPEVETSRGVKVGDSLDSALLAYNDVIQSESDTRYTATFGDIYFVIMGEGGVVKSMSFEQDAKL